MPRAYLSAASRVRQLERLVRTQFELTGEPCTVPLLSALAGLSYTATCSYVVRLGREQRVDIVVEDAAHGSKAKQLLYPRGAAPRRVKAAA